MHSPLHIRERRPDEVAVAVEISNAAYPEDWRSTVEEAKAWQALERPEDQILRLLAFDEGRPVGSGHVSHWQHGVEGRFNIGVAVIPTCRRRGIGRALYERLLAYAVEQGARELECEVRETDLAPIEGSLAKEGFREVSRMREAELRLTDFDFAGQAQAIQRCTDAGITLTTLAEEDTPENRIKLWELSNLTVRDIPFDVPHPDESFDRFEDMIDSSQCLRDALVIAKHGDEYVGLSILGRQTADRAFTWTTGVHSNWRNRGIALALKVRSVELARDRGYTAMRTFNHRNNPAMLAVNTRLGYVPLPEVIFFVKTLSTDGSPDAASR